MIAWRYRIFLSFLFPLGLNAQIATIEAHHAKAADVINLYNSKQSVQLYAQYSKEFKLSVTEKELKEFFEVQLYKNYGVAQAPVYLSDEKMFQRYLIQFESQSLQMNLSVNSKNEISGLQFLPYQPPSLRKMQEIPNDNPMATPLDSLVQKLFADFMQMPQNCGISLGILKNGKRNFYNYGETAREAKHLPDTNSIYEIGSLSKTFTGLLLAKAVTEGKLSLDDDIRKYLLGNYPNLSFADQPIKIVHLANHTSGLPRIPENLTNQPDYDSLNPYKNYSKKMLLDYLHQVKPEHPAGTICAYSNFGMALLGIILESVTNISYENLIQKNITLPYGMSNTGIRLNKEQEGHFVHGYNAEGIEMKHWDLGAFAPAGGLRSTSADMLRYMDFQLSEKDADIVLTHKITFNKNETIALAWQMQAKKRGGDFFWHNGGTYGFSSFCGFVKEKQSAVVILSNTALNLDYLAITLFNYLSNSH